MWILKGRKLGTKKTEMKKSAIGKLKLGKNKYREVWNERSFSYGQFLCHFMKHTVPFRRHSASSRLILGVIYATLFVNLAPLLVNN